MLQNLIIWMGNVYSDDTNDLFIYFYHNKSFSLKKKNNKWIATCILLQPNFDSVQHESTSITD